MAELKPCECPLCKTIPTACVVGHQVLPTKVPIWNIRHSCNGSEVMARGHSEEEAIGAWNQRAGEGNG